MSKMNFPLIPHMYFHLNENYKVFPFNLPLIIYSVENTSRKLMGGVSDMTLLTPYHLKLKKYGFHKYG